MVKANSSNNSTCITKEERAFRKQVLQPTVKNLFIQKLQSRNHKLKKFALSNTVEALKPTYPWVTADILKSKLRRQYANYKKTKKEGVVEEEEEEEEKGGEEALTPSHPTTPTTMVYQQHLIHVPTNIGSISSAVENTNIDGTVIIQNITFELNGKKCSVSLKGNNLGIQSTIMDVLRNGEDVKDLIGWSEYSRYKFTVFQCGDERLYFGNSFSKQKVSEVRNYENVKIPLYIQLERISTPLP